MTYSLHLRVEESAIDANGHVNNVQYLHWMQDAAIAHANDSGSTAITRELGASWVVRNHFVEYLRPAFLGDELEVQTWVTTLRKVSTIRKYRFYRRSDQTLLAEGETLWVFVEADTGKPRSISAEVAACFLPKEAL
jgi:acyl-CoA thioester hydrolase